MNKLKPCAPTEGSTVELQQLYKPGTLLYDFDVVWRPKQDSFKKSQEKGQCLIL